MNQTEEQEELLTPQEAAAFLKLDKPNSHLTVQRWARAGRIKGVPVGDQWRFRKSDLLQGTKR